MQAGASEAVTRARAFERRAGPYNQPSRLRSRLRLANSQRGGSRNGGNNGERQESVPQEVAARGRMHCANQTWQLGVRAQYARLAQIVPP
jgi:hypothetical protein